MGLQFLVIVHIIHHLIIYLLIQMLSQQRLRTGWIVAIGVLTSRFRCCSTISMETVKRMYGVLTSRFRCCSTSGDLDANDDNGCTYLTI
jgi:hypothetical protein